jgi:hypothetical protein
VNYQDTVKDSDQEQAKREISHMSTNSRTQLDVLMAQVQEMWGHLYTLFEDLNTSDRWDQKHGPDWTFADVPYHLAYCNRDLVARGMELGPDYAQEKKEPLVTPETLGDWNAHKLAERPFYQTPEQAVSRWQHSCEMIYRLAAGMNDADLEQRLFWMPLLGGWVTTRRGLEFCRNHDWSVFTRLRIHMGRAEPVPSPAVTRGYLETWMKFLPTLLNHAATNGEQSKMVMAFTDPYVGAWTIQVADGAATISEGAAADADLVVTQSAVAFEKSIGRMQNPIQAILAGEIQFSNFENLVSFGRLFQTMTQRGPNPSARA